MQIETRSPSKEPITTNSLHGIHVCQRIINLAQGDFPVCVVARSIPCTGFQQVLTVYSESEGNGSLEREKFIIKYAPGTGRSNQNFHLAYGGEGELKRASIFAYPESQNSLVYLGMEPEIRKKVIQKQNLEANIKELADIYRNMGREFTFSNTKLPANSQKTEDIFGPFRSKLKDILTGEEAKIFFALLDIKQKEHTTPLEEFIYMYLVGIYENPKHIVTYDFDRNLFRVVDMYDGIVNDNPKYLSLSDKEWPICVDPYVFAASSVLPRGNCDEAIHLKIHRYFIDRQGNIITIGNGEVLQIPSNIDLSKLTSTVLGSEWHTVFEKFGIGFTPETGSSYVS